MVKAIPDGYHTLTPYLVVRGADRAIDFYKKAFGAEELYRMAGPDGKTIMHAEIKIGDSRLMLAEEQPEMKAQSPQTLGGSPASLFVYSEDVDAAVQRAAKAGAKVTKPVEDMFWGDRFGAVEDPFGHSWSIATHKKDLTPDQMAKAAKEFFAKMATAKAK